MLLPNKHISVAESILGLGGFLLSELKRPKSIDQLHEFTAKACETRVLPAYHDFDSVVLAILFLYSIGAIEMTTSGAIQRCVS